MHKQAFCHKLFEKALPPSIHKKRRACLTRFVSSLLDDRCQLSVTQIGKRLHSKTTLKHNIKAADYFVNNQRFSEDIPVVYNGLAQMFFGGYEALTVLVDYTGACVPGYMCLEASVACHGRSIPVYQAIYSSKEQETVATHQDFLKTLHEVLPKGVKITLITDAGFHQDWFEQVMAYGWECIGRVYSRYQYQRAGETAWESVGNVPFAGYNKATALGAVTLGKTKHSLTGYLYAYRQRPSGKPHKKNPYPTHEKSYSDAFRQGWVIFSSLAWPADKLIRYYKQRMQIEQNFRDIKSPNRGIGLRANDSRGLTRCRMLYFIGTVVTILLWWIGLMVEAANEHLQFQANSVKNKRVRSFVHLARLKLRREDAQLLWRHFTEAITKLRLHYERFCLTGKLT